MNGIVYIKGVCLKGFGVGLRFRRWELVARKIGIKDILRENNLILIY